MVKVATHKHTRFTPAPRGRTYTAPTVEPIANTGVPTAPLVLDVRLADDESLVAALADGDAHALEVLYDRYSRAVYSLAWGLLGEQGSAEEVVQETFLKLWRRPLAYQTTRGRLLPWLLGIAHHHAVDVLRRRTLENRVLGRRTSGRQEASPGELDAVPELSREASPELQAGAQEQRRAVLEALAALPPAQRLTLELAYYRGLTQTEIAVALGEPLGTIKTRMRLGLQRLRATPELAALWRDA